MTRLSINKSEGSTLVFKEYSLLRSDRDTHLVCDSKENVRIGSVVEATTIYIYIYIYLAGLESTEVLVPSTENLNNYAHQ